jgi:hypothetical protein
MANKKEKFLSVVESTKNSLVNLATRRGWNYDVEQKGKVFDVTLYVPEDFDK